MVIVVVLSVVGVGVILCCCVVVGEEEKKDLVGDLLIVGEGVFILHLVVVLVLMLYLLLYLSHQCSPPLLLLPKDHIFCFLFVLQSRIFDVDGDIDCSLFLVTAILSWIAKPINEND